MLRHSNRQVAQSLGISHGKAGDTAVRARLRALTWEQIAALSDDALEQRLFGRRACMRQDRPLPDPAYLHTELRRAGVTLQLLHLEYLEQHPDGFRYTAFCNRYSEWLARQNPTMRQVHRAGEKLFVDYSGNRPRNRRSRDRRGGRCRAVRRRAWCVKSHLCRSNQNAAGSRLDRQPCQCVRLFRRVPKAVVPDQLKSGVTRFAGTSPVSSARTRKWQRTTEPPSCPRGQKAREKRPRWKRACSSPRGGFSKIRNQIFFSVNELNERIAELVEDLNARKMRVYGASRRELFDRVERSALGALPSTRFTPGEWATATINIDYHVEFDHHYYSVPSTLARQRVDIRATLGSVEILLRGDRIASHPRSSHRGQHTTTPAHMPKAHQAHVEWTPSRIISWAATVGPATAALTQAILGDRPHPEQGYRSCLGILRLSKKYGPERIEVACGRAIAVGARSYRHVESILKHGLDQLAAAEAKASPRIHHVNIRGRNYYH